MEAWMLAGVVGPGLGSMTMPSDDAMTEPYLVRRIGEAINRRPLPVVDLSRAPSGAHHAIDESDFSGGIFFCFGGCQLATVLSLPSQSSSEQSRVTG
jgi:hypothetical protein